MMLKTAARPQILTAGLSVAFFALMTGASLAQDTELTDPSVIPGEELILVIDPSEGCDPCDTPVDEVFVDPMDPIILQDVVIDDPVIMTFGGEPMNIDGIGDGEPLPVNIDGIGDGEPLPDVVVDDEMGGEVGEEPVVTTTDFPDSNCGGCEYQTMAGGPEVQRTNVEVTETSLSGGIEAAASSVRNDTNICFDADLYVPLLCDWQRPFLGDKMP
jgi:hypothetical protein